MDEKGVLMWSRGRAGTRLDSVAVEAAAETLVGIKGMDGVLQDNLGMIHGKRYRLIAEEAPEPCPEPEPKDEMVVKVFAEGKDGRCQTYTDTNVCRISPIGLKGIVGVYSVPGRFCADCVTRASLLIAIRDAGGTCLAGEPLPEKVVETWARVTCPNSVPSCGACGGAIPREATGCHLCHTKLSGEVPWKPYPPNRGC